LNTLHQGGTPSLVASNSKSLDRDATDRLQYWNDYLPQDPLAKFESRYPTRAVSRPARKFPREFECCAEGNYVLEADFKIWPQGAPEPAAKTRPSAGSSKLNATCTSGRRGSPKMMLRGEIPGGVEAGRAVQAGRRSAGAALRCCGSGKAWTELNSVDITISLGRADAERSAGLLLLRAETVSAELFSPAALAVVDSSVLDVRRTTAGEIQQVKAPGDLGRCSYSHGRKLELRVHQSGQIGALDAPSGRYLTSSAPFKVYTVANANPGVSTTTLRFDDSDGPSTLFTYDAATRTQTMSQLGGSRVEASPNQPTA